MAKWTLFAHNGREYGLVDKKELVFWIKERRISPDDLVKAEGNREWEIIGEVTLFGSYFKDKVTEAGALKKGLKNEIENVIKNKPVDAPTTSIETPSGINCAGCNFLDAVERLHEEKKALEEKLAEEKNRTLLNKPV